MEERSTRLGKGRQCFANVLVVVFLMLPTMCVVPQAGCNKASPCCSFPCKNGGSCVETREGYRCDCKGTNFYGRNCQIERMSHKLKKSIWAGATILGLSRLVTDVRLAQHEPKFSKDHGGFCNENFNVGQEPMMLSPVPEHCPTPLGTSGFQILPSVENIFGLVLKRQCSICHAPTSTNLLFVVFAQFMANQMWSTTNSNWIGSSAMYGNFGRTGMYGKVFKLQSGQRGNMYQNVFTDAFQSIIIREHNRVCGVLSQEHPRWSDHRLFETATLIVTGEILTIASTEWLPLLQDFRGTAKSSYPYIVSNKVPKEIKLGFFWPQLFPDSVTIEGSNLDLGVLVYGADRALPQASLYQLMKFLATTTPGKMGSQNVPPGMEEPVKNLIVEGRKWRFQSFNNYREFLGLGRMSSFSKLTGNDVVKKHLENMYGDIDGLEMIPGLLLETPKRGELLGETTKALISNVIVKAVLTHPLNTVPFNKKFTFGGKTGWNIVKNAKIRDLICNNVCDKRLCVREGLISFKKKIPHPLPNSATSMKAGKAQRSRCCRKGKTAKKCLPLTPAKSVCNDPRPVSVQPCLEKVKDIEQAQKMNCAPPASKCSLKTPQPCTVAVKTTECKAPKKCCVKRPWFRTSSNSEKVIQRPSCIQKATCPKTSSCAPKNIENVKADLKQESSCKSQKTTSPCSLKAPIVAQVQPKICTIESPEAKKCCAKRPWFRAITKKVCPRKEIQKPACTPKKISSGAKVNARPACAPKKIASGAKINARSACAPKKIGRGAKVNAKSACASKKIRRDAEINLRSASPCKTPEKPLEAKKCCIKRSWFKAWTG